MKLTIASTILLAAAVGAPADAQQYGSKPAPRGTIAPVPAPAQEPATQPKVNISKRAAKAFIELQKAVEANDTANIPAKLAAAEAVADTKDDHYAIARLHLKAALAANDNAGVGAAVDAAVASGFLDAASSAQLYNAAGVRYYNAKDFPRAAGLFERAATADPRNPEPIKLLAEARNAAGQKAEGSALLAKALQLTAAGGKKPDEDLYKRAVAMAYEAKSPSAVSLGREWVTAYPGADSWHNAIAIYRNINHPNVQGSLDLLRLMRATGAMTTSGDYMLYATAAADQGNFGEAQAVLDEGLANKRVELTDSVVRETFNGLKTKPKAAAADLEAAVKMAPTAVSLMRIGDRFYGLGDYARAAALYRQGQAKGADAGLANLHLGMALARSGDRVGATTALNAVAGDNAEIAKYWLLYVNRAS